MREITGDLWDYFEQDKCLCCITTNGFVKNNGEAVMGAGCAKQAVERFPALPKNLGRMIKQNGNVVQVVSAAVRGGDSVISFPVKHKWWEEADPKLISESAGALNKMARNNPDKKFVLPRPGCGNGKLQWKDVKPLLKKLPDNVLVISYE